MRYALIVGLAALVVGCTTVEMVRTEGERSTHTLKQPAPDAAGCMARNIESYRSGIIAAVRPAGNGAMEVIVRHGVEFVFAVAVIAPAAKGSTATVWLKPGAFVGRDEYVPTLIAGC